MYLKDNFCRSRLIGAGAALSALTLAAGLIAVTPSSAHARAGRALSAGATVTTTPSSTDTVSTTATSQATTTVGTTSVSRRAQAQPERPSGQAMPVGNISGWRQVFADNFNGNKLNTKLWEAYSGTPSDDKNGMWSPNNIAVKNGELILRTYKVGSRYVSAGVSSAPGLVQTYGKYLVRYRISRGLGVSHAVLLWPASNIPGPEIDFSEDNGTNRAETSVFLHWAVNKGQTTPFQLQAHHFVNLTKWNTLGVQWSPGEVVYTINGKVWDTMRTRHAPSIPMVLDLQTQTWCGPGQAPPNSWERCVNGTTPREVDMDVDWVVAYARG